MRYGLIGEKGNVLLPVEYEQIGNPGFILDDYVEVKQNGKYGLYNYADEKLIPAEYDLIYPSRIMEYVAIGQKGNTFYKIYADGKTKAFKDDQPGPDYARLLKDYRFNTESKHYGYWLTTAALADLGSDEFYPYSMGLVVMPSYMARLKLIENDFTYVGMGWDEFDGDSLDLKVIGVQKRSEDISSSLLSFYSYTADARGYDSEEFYLVNTNRKNAVRASKNLLRASNYDLQNSNDNDLARPKVRFVNDSTVEVRRFVVGGFEDIYEPEPDEKFIDHAEDRMAMPVYRPYHNYTKYEYYTISSDGRVSALTDGVFPMASAIVLTKDYFRGCFARLMGSEEMRLTDAFDEEMESSPMLAFTDHLSLADLEYMRNEIYARHGMKFKDPAWSAAFSQYKWYKPKRSNVNSLLTPIEKKNLELIRQVEKQLRANPEALIHEEQKYMVIAG
jgi:hypothetical protein